MKNTAYLLQATLICLWWIVLTMDSDFYNAFQFPGISPLAIDVFMLPDLIIVALLIVIRSYYKKESISYIIL